MKFGIQLPTTKEGMTYRILTDDDLDSLLTMPERLSRSSRRHSVPSPEDTWLPRRAFK